MQDKVDGQSRKEWVEEASAQHVQQPQDERRAVQKRTFTRWMNVFLHRRDPPLEVHDLFTDIQDGSILMALLEELTGCKLLYRFRSSSHRIFRLNNISKALAFLDDRHVKLLGIDASGIADGIPSVILNLVWNIILYLQVKEITVGLRRHLTTSSLSSFSVGSDPPSIDLTPPPNYTSCFSCSTMPGDGRVKAATEPKYQGKAIKTLLQWVQRCTSKFGVEVRDFGRSWRSGLAFLAVIKSINPALVDLRESLSRGPRENICSAFMIASHGLDVPPLLEPEDVLCTSPDEKSIITYVSMFLGPRSGTDQDCGADTDIPRIPHFGSLESVVGLRETTLADDPEAQALLKGFGRSREQLLWKRWARRPSSQSLRGTSCSADGDVTSPELSCICGVIFSSPCRSQSIGRRPSDTSTSFNAKNGGRRSLSKPPSPLDADVSSQEIQSWMEKAPVCQESHFSLSSEEEGIYSLSALDSDEEEAYSYILDLNKEVFQPHNQPRRQVLRVEEETEEEMSRQSEEKEHLEACKTLHGGGCKHGEGPRLNFDLGVKGARSGVQREFDWDENDSGFRETANNNGAVFDTEPGEEEESGRREGHQEEAVVRGQSNDDGDCCEEQRKEKERKTENARLVTHVYDITQAREDETGTTRLFEVTGWTNGVEVESEREPFEGCGRARERRAGESLMTFKNAKNRKSGTGKEDEGKGKEKDREMGNPQRDVNVEAEVGINGGKSYKKDNVPKMEDFSCKDKEKDSDDINNSMDFGAVVTTEEGDGELNMERRELTDKKASIVDHRAKKPPKSDSNAGINVHSGDNRWTRDCGMTSQSSRNGGFSLHSLAASCNVTPLELNILVFLWIVLYCCFILPPINL